MHKSMKVKIKGVAPLLIHSGQLANPMNPFVVEMKKVTGKRTKTDTDFEEMARIEFLGSLYLNEKGAPCVPGENIEAMLIAAAKGTRKGKEWTAGVLVDESPEIVYTGPKSAEGLWKSGKFMDQRMVIVNRSRVLRTRPIFRDWALEFTIFYLPEMVDEKSIPDVLKRGGEIVGLGDYRPKFGRFEIV